VVDEVFHAPDDEVIGVFVLLACIRIPAVLRLLAVPMDKHLGSFISLAHRPGDCEVEVGAEAEGVLFTALEDDHP